MSALGTWREKDEIGVGYAFVDFNNPNNTQLNNQGEQDASNLEQVVETYYRVQVGDHFSVVPSVQLIMNSFGMSANNIRTLVGVRTNYTF
jgi:carbohydrate-selective porin OprB